jgi:hypothetical protein
VPERLEDLRFLDGLPELTRDDLGPSKKYRSCGIPGPFRETFGDKARYYGEVASVYAEIFHCYGYLTVDRLLPDGTWPALLAAADSAYTDRNTCLSEIVETFGPPSFKIHKYAYCYAPENRTGWVFFDGFAYTSDEDGAPEPTFSGYPSDPGLRSIRLPGPTSRSHCGSLGKAKPLCPASLSTSPIILLNFAVPEVARGSAAVSSAPT